MGASYGSTQVRTTGRDEVIAIAESVARDKKVRCLVGPPINNWVGVYPQEHGQDHEFGAAIAAKTQADVLHVLVHDDSVMYYWLWRQGQLVDRYCSRPGYFGDEDFADENSMRGNVDAFAAIITGRPERLAGILDRNKEEVFETQRLVRFAKALGIANLAASYEDLQSDDFPGIRGRRQFLELPAPPATDGKPAKPLMPAQQRRQLMKRGLLYMEQGYRDTLPLVIRPIANGFFLATNELRDGQWKPRVELLVPPWKSAVPLDIGDGPDCVFVTGTAPQANRAAMVRGDLIELWSVDPIRRVSEIAAPAGTGWISMTPDGEHVVCAAESRSVVIRSDTGERMGQIPCRAVQGAFHPSGRWMAFVVGGHQLVIVERPWTGDPQLRQFSQPPRMPSVCASYEQMFACGFSDGGRLLWSVSGSGILIYEWAAVVASGSDMPAPLRSVYTLSCDDVGYRGAPIGVGVIGEPTGTGLLFEMFDRQTMLHRLDCVTGQMRQLVPLQGAIPSLYLSADGNSLLCEETVGRAPRVRVWNYPALLQEPAI